MNNIHYIYRLKFDVIKKKKSQSRPEITQVSDAALQIFLHQDILALQVSVSDGRFAFSAKNLRVQVHQPAGYRRRHVQPICHLHGNTLQVVIERAVLVIVCDEPQLSAGVSGGHVRSHESWKESLK